KSENDVRLQATLGNQNPTGLPVGVVRPMSFIRKSASDRYWSSTTFWNLLTFGLFLLFLLSQSKRFI
ncbi:hypothetical protein, partial [uncultured Catenibacterium sp.]